MSLEIMTSVDLNENSVTGIPDNIQTVGGKKMHALDDALSDVSENPVQNKAIKAQLDALDAKIAEKSVNVDGRSVMKGTVNNKEVLYAVGYRNIVNNVEKGESFNVSFNGGEPPAGSLTAIGLQSHAEGKTTTASGDYSHAEGYSSATTGTASHAEGNTTVASGNYSHAEGHQVTAYGEASHAEGYGEGVYQSSMGTDAESLYNIAGSVHFSLALTECSHVEGKSTAALGSQSHAEGYGTRALGNYTHVEGYQTSVSNSLAHGSHAEGWLTDVYGMSAHAEGYQTRAVGNYSHAEGSGWNNIPAKYINTQGISQTVQMWAGGADLNVAYGNDSHSEGNSCCATGDQSHAEGHESLAYGKDSHAEGYQCIAYGNHSHAEGSCSNKYNFIFNGIDDDIIIPYFAAHPFSMAKGNSSHVEGMNNLAVSDYSHAEGYCNMAKGAYTHVEGYKNSTKADYSHAEGSSNKIDASAAHSHVEGDANKLLSGAWRSHAEGYGNTASGDVSHVEGYQNTVSGSYAHAEGYQTEAAGVGSHTEGSSNTIFGSYSHVEGGHNISRGQYTHVEGYGNKIKSSEISGDNPLIAGAHISGAFNYIDGGADYSKGGIFIAGSLNHTHYYGAYAGFAAGQGNFICDSAFAIGRSLVARSCCGSVGSWNRISSTPQVIPVKMKYSSESDEDRHNVIIKKHTDGTIIRLIVVLDGLKENNEISRFDITSVKVNDVSVKGIYFSIAVDPLGCENYGPIGTYYLLIEADGFAPDPDGKYIVDFEYSETELGDKNIFTVGNGLYAADEDTDDFHNANALAVTYDGTTKVQNDITFKYVDGSNQKHRISLQKIVTALIGLGVNLSDLELLNESDM